MILRQRATVKRSFTIPELRPQPTRSSANRSVSAPQGEETQPQNPATSQPGEAPDQTRIRILTVDNHPLFRAGIACILNREPDIVLVLQASTGQEGIQLYRDHLPDIVLMEIRLPDLPGINALMAIRDEFPAARVVILTACEGDVEAQRALEAGASGYLLKNTPPGEFLREIRRVHSGQKAIQPKLAVKIAEHTGEGTLTAREVEVLAMVAQGNRNREIGAQLCIAEETVKVHMKRIMEKLAARDRTQAVVMAFRRGIIGL